MEVRGFVWSPTSSCSAYLCSQLEGLEAFPAKGAISSFPVELICAKLCRDTAGGWQDELLVHIADVT